MAQRLRLCPSNPGVTGSIPALGTKILGWGTKISSAAKKKEGVKDGSKVFCLRQLI